MEELHVIFKGRVQGVFFRDTTKLFAKELGIHGTVRNRESGEVELVAQGSRTGLESLLERLKSEGPGHIESVEIDYREASVPFSDFRVIR